MRNKDKDDYEEIIYSQKAKIDCVNQRINKEHKRVFYFIDDNAQV